MMGRRNSDAEERRAVQSRVEVTVGGCTRRATGQLLLLVAAGIEGGRSRYLRGGELRWRRPRGGQLCVVRRQGIWIEDSRRCSRTAAGSL